MWLPAASPGTGSSGHSPCSSLLAAARRVEEVLATSVLGVPGLLVPFELPPDGFRSLLGGVFFFYRGGHESEGSEGHLSHLSPDNSLALPP